MLNNNEHATESEGKKKKLDFDLILEQILYISRDSPMCNNPRSPKTSALKSKYKSKTFCHKTSSYCNKPSQFKRNCYFQYLENSKKTF